MFNLLEFLAEAMPCASFSMFDGPGGTGCDVPVHGCWDSRDVTVAGVFDSVKECMGFVMYLIIYYVGWGLFIMFVKTPVEQVLA